jgi:hypothetical protein
MDAAAKDMISRPIDSTDDLRSVSTRPAVDNKVRIPRCLIFCSRESDGSVDGAKQTDRGKLDDSPDSTLAWPDS